MVLEETSLGKDLIRSVLLLEFMEEVMEEAHSLLRRLLILMVTQASIEASSLSRHLIVLLIIQEVIEARGLLRQLLLRVIDKTINPFGLIIILIEFPLSVTVC